MSVLSPRGGKNPSSNLTPEQLARMKELWECALEMSAEAIAAEFGVSKNTVIGQAYRRNWPAREDCRRASFGGSPKQSGLHQRLDALHAKLDAVLAETRPYIEGQYVVPVKAEAAE